MSEEYVDNDIDDDNTAAMVAVMVRVGVIYLVTFILVIICSVLISQLHVGTIPTYILQFLIAQRLYDSTHSLLYDEARPHPFLSFFQRKATKIRGWEGWKAWRKL